MTEDLRTLPRNHERPRRTGRSHPPGLATDPRPRPSPDRRERSTKPPAPSLRVLHRGTRTMMIAWDDAVVVGGVFAAVAVGSPVLAAVVFYVCFGSWLINELWATTGAA
jgi:hypothetical protein